MVRRAAISILGSLALVAALPAQQTPKLDTTSFVVMGEGLAAGMANFGLNEAVQRYSFPALTAAQMKTVFAQPLIEGVGFADVLGYPAQPVRIPTYPTFQTRIYPSQPNSNDDAPTLFVFNLSVPNYKLQDAISRKPIPPLIHNNDLQQTVINLILGFPSLILDKDVPLWTQLEYAVAMNPTMALVELGYFEALDAAVNQDPNRIPTAANFRAAYTQVVKALRGIQAQVICTTIPDPADSAYFIAAPTALRFLRATPLVLYAGYNIRPEDYVTRNGLNSVGYQLFRRQIEKDKIPAGSFASQSLLDNIRTRVNALNTEINNIAKENNAVVYDLNAFLHRVKTSGMRAGNVTVNADYFGGFYSTDGYYPGATGHALIANDLLAFLNKTYGQNFPLVDLTSIVSTDPALQYKFTTGSVFNPTGASGEVTEVPDPSEQ